MIPTRARKKLTAASLNVIVSTLVLHSFFLTMTEGLVSFYSQHVLGLDDEAPTRPDQTGAHEGEVLRKGQLLSGSSEIGNTCQDKSPLLRIRSQPDIQP